MKNNIELRQLKHTLTPTLVTQVTKCREEMEEFITGVLRNDTENELEEFHDVIQAMLSALQLNNIPVEEIAEAQDDHYKKLIKRGWKFND